MLLKEDWFKLVDSIVGEESDMLCGKGGVV